MKKFTRTMALALVTAMLLSMTAFAAPTVKPEGGKTVTPGALANNDKSFQSITYADGRIVTDGQYMIFVVTPDGGSYVPTASSILYINQETGADGEVTFNNVFPKTMKNSGIMISGTGLTDGPELIAKIIAALLGDVDADGDITASDSAAILRAIANDTILVGDQAFAADTDNDTDITASDAAKILRFIAGLITEM